MNIVAIESLLGLVGLWVAICYLWRDFRTDSYREDIFSVRDEMFLYAVDEDLFNHPAHTLLRARMNGLLRHGQELTMTRLLILLAVYDRRVCRSESFEAWERALEELPAKARERFRDFNMKVNVYVAIHVVYLSLFRYLVLRPFATGMSVQHVLKTPHVVKTVEKLESATLDEEEAAELAPA